MLRGPGSICATPPAECTFKDNIRDVRLPIAQQNTGNTTALDIPRGRLKLCQERRGGRLLQRSQGSYPTIQ